MWVTVGLILSLAANAAGAPSQSRERPDSAGEGVSEQALRAYAQGRLLEARGDDREALGEYIRALAVDAHTVALARRVAELVARLGDAKGAIEFADRALALDSTDARSLWIKGSALLTMGQANQALPLLQACAAHDATRMEYLRSLAHAAEATGRIDLVVWAYGRAAELDEDDGESWFQLAVAQARMGSFAAADSSLRLASERSPLRPGQLFLQGWIAESLGRDDEALDRYRHHLQVHPQDLTTRRRLVNLLARRQRWAEAWREAQRVSRAAPDDWDTIEVEADLALRAGRTSEARAPIELLQRLAEADADRVARLCALLVHNRRGSDAIHMADGWGARHAQDPAAPLLAARVRGLAGQHEAALPFARKAVAVAPDSLAPRLLLARLCALSRRFDEAESTLAGASRDHPSNVGLLLELANVCEDGGRSDRAESAARDALRLAPDSPQVLNSLGYLMAEHNLHLEEAERMIRRAMEQDPDNGAYIDSLGWVFYRLGRLEDARSQLERAIELTGGDAVVREHLGDVYRELKQPDRAREQYRLSLARDDSNARVRAKLAGIKP